MEEDGNGFGDQKAILEQMDQFELSQSTRKDFEVKPVGSNGALIRYLADYNGKSPKNSCKQKPHTARFGPDKVNEGKLLYV